MKINRQQIIIGAVILVTLIIVLIIGSKFMTKNKNVEEKKANLEEINQDVIPTVSSSVEVTLEKATGGKEIILSVANIPSGTQSIDYELSYQTAKQGLQGVIGTISTTGESKYEKKITLGTCSSGTCVYHEVVGKIKLSLKFSGDYGERIFEKEF